MNSISLGSNESNQNSKTSVKDGKHLVCLVQGREVETAGNTN